ncbi:MAG: hypothetical protein NTV30_04445 [Chloroflexi bacterium]|nr:hypothetical protein [Chloroflexota bacterium]
MIDTAKIQQLLNTILIGEEAARYDSFKTLYLIAQDNPEVVYPYWDKFALLLEDKPDKKYIAVYMLTKLTKVDSERRFEKLFDKYFSLLDDESIIPAAHAALNSGEIALNIPELQSKITHALLGIDATHHEKGRKGLIKSYIIEAFNYYYDTSTDKDEITTFVKNQKESSSPKTRKLVKEFLKEHNIL